VNRSNDYVFPGTGAAGHIVEPRKQMAKVTMYSDIHFTVHDLRRTFITIAESLDIPAYALKRLLNHKMANDVTAGYIVADVERLRKPMQLITDYILKCMGVIKSAEIIAIQPVEKELLK
jgi:integrase